MFSAPDRIFQDALTILLALYPVAVRFSCAIGEISTVINSKQAIGMDGPAFHDARATIDRLKKTDSLFAIAGPPEPVEVGLDDKARCEIRSGLKAGERVVVGRRASEAKTSAMPAPPGGL